MRMTPKNPNLVMAMAVQPTLVDILSQCNGEGEYRWIVKTKLGMTSVDGRSFDNDRCSKYPESIINGYKRGGIQTVQFKPKGFETYLTIFSRVGKKVKLVDETILLNLTVGTINSMYDNTNLMDSNQYKAVNSKVWASKAFTMNEVEVKKITELDLAQQIDKAFQKEGVTGEELKIFTVN